MNPRNIVYVSSLPPTSCGVAEYTTTLADAIQDRGPANQSHFIRLDYDSIHSARSESTLTINPAAVEEIELAANSINRLGHAVVLLQHEFKLFGGCDGENVIGFLAALKAPVITTLHTVWPSFPEKRKRVFVGVIHLSQVLVVFTHIAREILIKEYSVAPNKIRVIPHGVPFASFRWPKDVKWPANSRTGVKFVSLGLLRPAKGVEQVLAAFYELKRTFQDFTYVICGANHPRCAIAPEYRTQLCSLVARYGLEGNVVFVNRFLDRQEIVEAIQSCDVGITPYTSPQQSSSGVLALLLGCGRPVISTDFQYAKASLEERNGILVPMGDLDALFSALQRLALDEVLRNEMMKESYNATRSWVWCEVASKHLDAVTEVEGSTRSSTSDETSLLYCLPGANDRIPHVSGAADCLKACSQPSYTEPRAIK